MTVHKHWFWLQLTSKCSPILPCRRLWAAERDGLLSRQPVWPSTVWRSGSKLHNSLTLSHLTTWEGNLVTVQIRLSSVSSLKEWPFIMSFSVWMYLAPTGQLCFHNLHPSSVLIISLRELLGGCPLWAHWQSVTRLTQRDNHSTNTTYQQFSITI